MTFIFTNNNLAKFASLVILVAFLCYSLYSGFIYLFFRSHYKGIHFTTKNITNISMLSAASVAMTVLVAYYAPVTVLPPIRISFEGLMIKITGFIFGPIVGVLSGLITDMFCILFIPSYYHVAYTIIIMSYGFISGMTHILNKIVKNKKYIMFITTNLFIMLYFVFFTYSILQLPDEPILLYESIMVTKTTLIIILLISILSIIFFQWIIFFVYLFYKKRNKNSFLNTSTKFDDIKINKKPFIDENILCITFMSIITEYYVTGLIAPWGDSSLFMPQTSSNDSSAYMMLLLFRILEAPLKVFFNTLIIYLTFRTIAPLVRRD